MGDVNHRPHIFTDLTTIMVFTNPTENTWEAIRPHFLYIYLDLNKTLPETMHQLEQEYGFYATRKMYMNHIRKWRAFKNVKAREKDELIEAAKTTTQDSTARSHMPKLTVHGRAVSWDKLDRYQVTKAKQAASTSSTARDRSPQRRRRPRSASAKIAITCLASKDDLRLRAAATLFRWHTTVVLSGTDYVRNFSIDNTFYDGIRLLQRGSAAGWTKMHQVCDQIRTTLTSDPVSVYHMLARACNATPWQGKASLLTSLLGFVKDLALTLVPIKDFARLLELASDVEIFKTTSYNTVKLALDMTVARLEREDNPALIESCMESLWVLVDSGKYALARQYVQNLPSCTVEKYSDRIMRVRLLRLVAYTLFREGKYAEAVVEASDGLLNADIALSCQLNQPATDALHRQMARLHAIQAWSYEELGKSDLSVLACRNAWQQSNALVGNIELKNHTYQEWHRSLGLKARLDSATISKIVGIVPIACDDRPLRGREILAETHHMGMTFSDIYIHGASNHTIQNYYDPASQLQPFPRTLGTERRATVIQWPIPPTFSGPEVVKNLDGKEYFQ